MVRISLTGLDRCGVVAPATAATGRCCGGDQSTPKPSAKIAPPPTVRRNDTPTVRCTVQPPSLSWIRRAVYGWPYGTLSTKKEATCDVTDRAIGYYKWHPPRQMGWGRTHLESTHVGPDRPYRDRRARSR